MSAVEAEFLKAQQARLGRLEEKKTARRRLQLDLEQQQEQLQHQNEQQPLHVKNEQASTYSGTGMMAGENKGNKHKFVFKRYRQAIALRLEQQQKQQLKQEQLPQGVEDTQQHDERCRSEVEESVTMDDLTLHGYENMIIHIWDNHVEILSSQTTTPKNASASDTNDTTILPHNAHHHPPTVLRNLRHCHVYYHLDTTTKLDKSSSCVSFCWKTTTLHFVNLHDSTITFLMDSDSHQNTDCHSRSTCLAGGNDIASIHVTNCHGCTFSSKSDCDDDNNNRRYNNNAKDNSALRFLSCQQLRLHQSSQLDIFLDVTAGAILEDCTRIVFYRRRQQQQENNNNNNNNNSDKHHSLSVQDFGWLRPGVPSPNYQILPLVMYVPKSLAQCTQEPPPTTTASAAITTVEQQQQQQQNKVQEEEPSNVNNAENNAGDDSDDDEL